MNCSIISPNHEELKMFFAPEIVQNASQADLVAKLMPWNVSMDGSGTNTSSPVAIVREGASGSTAYFAHASTFSEIISVHLPAYHSLQMATSVVDPTGGGNTYLGALAIALTDALYGQASYEKICKHLQVAVPKKASQTINGANQPSLQNKVSVQVVVVAMIYALIAASFAIEQNGTPTLRQEKVFTEIIEYWNGEKVIDRLEKYLAREGEMIRDQLRQIQSEP